MRSISSLTQEFSFLLYFSNVPARYAENRKLGIWVSAQRQQKKLMESTADETSHIKSTPLTQDRIDLLDEIGFTWTIRSRDSLGESWNQRLAELSAYKEKYGNCLVPSRYNPNPELGIWVRKWLVSFAFVFNHDQTLTPCWYTISTGWHAKNSVSPVQEGEGRGHVYFQLGHE